MNSKIKSFEDLEIWKLSYSLTLEIYKLVKSFLTDEKYILIQQLIRSSQSIPANIAEGMGRFSKIEKSQFKNLKENYILLGKKINSLINSIKSKK